MLSASAAYLWAMIAALALALIGARRLPSPALPLQRRLLLICVLLQGAALLVLIGRAGIPAYTLAAGLAGGILLRRMRQLRRARAVPAGSAALSELRRLTPGLIAFIRIALSSYEAPAAVLARYCRQVQPGRRPMQQLVDRALQLSEQQRLRPFAALAQTARRAGCRELIDAADALAQAEAYGSPVDDVLAAQQQTLEYLLQSEFRRLIRRRTVYLLLLTALSLVGGILINVLYVMTEGGRLLTELGFS